LSQILEEFLQWGVTTIRNVGDAFPWIVRPRDEIAQGKRRGPRIAAAGPLLTAPHGHPAGTLLRGNQEAIDLATRQLNDAQEAKRVVRELADGGVDFIKAVFDSGGRRNGPSFPRIDTSILQALVMEARWHGLFVTVHWGNVDELGDILSTQPHQIEHAGYSPIPERMLESIVRDRIFVDPTLSVLETIVSPDDFVAGPLTNVRRLAAVGATITAGTDAPLGNQQFGRSLHRELELLVQAGLSPLQAITAATGNAAQTFAWGSEIGVIREGRRADMILVKGDPLESLEHLRRIALVVKDGRICEGIGNDAMVGRA
jgi:enamidase